MVNKIKIFYYLSSIALFIVLKFLFKFSSINDLLFLLRPTNAVISVITNSPFTFIVDQGYFLPKLNILIDKSCAGYNLWLLSFLILNFLLLKYSTTMWHKLISIPASLIVAYLFTIFVNSSRIYVSIVMQNKIVLDSINQDYIHESIGILTNLSFLILGYYLTEKFLIYKKFNAKST